MPTIVDFPTMPRLRCGLAAISAIPPASGLHSKANTISLWSNATAVRR